MDGKDQVHHIKEYFERGSFKMRIKIDGQFDIEGLKKTLSQALDMAVEQLQIEQFSGVNIYFTPRDSEGKRVQFVDENGDEVGLIFYSKSKKELPKPKLHRVK